MLRKPSVKTTAAALPPRPPLRQVCLVWFGSCLAIMSIALLSRYSDQPWVLGSFGASCVLLFGFPDAVFSQTRNLIGGHLVCSLIGLAFLKFAGPDWWAMALAVSSALAAMLLTQTVHPPAGSNPVIIYLTKPDWQFLWFPTLSGALVLWAVSRIYLKLCYGKR
ncbi:MULTISPECIES: HPP family protein [Methylomonas]|nr:HPP family protein [Methylomonas koyamae]